jgi:hypothetical protein
VKAETARAAATKAESDRLAQGKEVMDAQFRGSRVILPKLEHQKEHFKTGLSELDRLIRKVQFKMNNI